MIRAILAALLLSGLYQVPIPTLTGLLAFAVVYLFYVYWVFKEWNIHFSGHRTTRRDKNNPSNRKMPPIKTLQENKEMILNNSKHHEQFDTCELLNDVKNMEVTRKENQVIRQRAKRTMSLSVKALGHLGEKMTGALLGSLNHVEAAEELNMDHVCVSIWLDPSFCCRSFDCHKRALMSLYLYSLARMHVVQLCPLLRFSLGIYFHRSILLHVVEASHDYSPHPSVPLEA